MAGSFPPDTYDFVRRNEGPNHFLCYRPSASCNFYNALMVTLPLPSGFDFSSATNKKVYHQRARPIYGKLIVHAYCRYGLLYIYGFSCAFYPFETDIDLFKRQDQLLGTFNLPITYC